MSEFSVADSAAHRLLSGLLQARTGQIISNSRLWRVDMVLKPVMERFAIPDLDSLVAVIMAAQSDELQQAVIEAMLNNESYFFRDTAMFETLRHDVLPHLRGLNAASRQLRIWSAGCSSGQEAYSLAMMILDDPAAWHGWNVRITGTDISQRMIDQAIRGAYSPFEIQRGLSTRQMLRHFDQQGDKWVASEDLRRMVTFRQDNLLRPLLGSVPFDLVLCRNVIMYFSPEIRHIAYGRLHRATAPHGLLMLGAAETVIGHTESFVASRTFRGLYENCPDTPKPQVMAG